MPLAIFELCFTLPASPSLREGRKRGFASFRGGALRERVENRKLRGEEEEEVEEEVEEEGEERKARTVGKCAVSGTPHLDRACSSPPALLSTFYSLLSAQPPSPTARKASPSTLPEGG
jgi:hypothetical protein